MLNTITGLSAASIFLGYSLLVIALVRCTRRRRSWINYAMPALFPVALIVLSVAMLAQQSGDTDRSLPDSSIEGLVILDGTSGSSTVLQGVKLTITEGRLHEKSLSVFTDEEGHYQFDGLRPGTYQLKVTVKGCQSFATTVHLGLDELHVKEIALHAEIVASEPQLSAGTGRK
jgi:hypothetical protein